jgi:hypothetical protein
LASKSLAHLLICMPPARALYFVYVGSFKKDAHVEFEKAYCHFKTLFWFGLSGLLTTLAILLNACSPISPSVSKFVNSQSPAPSSSQQDDLSVFVHDQGNSLDNTGSFSYGSNLYARVVSRSEIQNSSLISGASSELATSDLSEFMSNGLTEFTVNNSVKALGTKMFTSNVYVYYVVSNLSFEERIELQNSIDSDLEFCGTNLSKVCNADFRMELKQPSYSGDPAQDTASQHPRNILMHNLVGIVLEFRSN